MSVNERSAYGSTVASRRKRFEELFDANVRAVSGYARRRAPASEADDVVAETFLVAWRRLDDVPVMAKPWLLGIARRVVANQRRAAIRRAALTERIAHHPAGTSHDDGRPVVRALSLLAERDREVLLLTAWDGLSCDEAAAVLGCSRTATKVRLHRAKRRLRAAFEQLDASEPLLPPASIRRLEECHDE